MRRSQFEQYDVAGKLAELLRKWEEEQLGRKRSWLTIQRAASMMRAEYDWLRPIAGLRSSPRGEIFIPRVADYLWTNLERVPHPELELSVLDRGMEEERLIRWRPAAVEGEPGIYARKLNGAQRRMLREYVALCGLEPLGQEQLDAGEITFEQLWNENVNHLHLIYCSVSNISREGSGI